MKNCSNCNDHFPDKQIKCPRCDHCLTEINSKKEKDFLFPFEEVNIEKKEKSIFLQWKWPKESEYALVMVSSDQYVTSPNDNTAENFIIKRKGKISFGEYTYNIGPVDIDCFFTFFNIDKKNEKYSESYKEKVISNELQRIHYWIEPKLLVKNIYNSSKILELVLKGKEGLKVGSMILKGCENNMPLKVNDGRTILSIKSLEFKKEILRKEIPNKFFKSDLYAKLFFEDTKAHEKFRLMPKLKENMKLSLEKK